MQFRSDATEEMRRGLDDIRASFDVPGEFPAEVVAAAEAAAARPLGDEHVDRTAWEFVTLDPAASKDLDQAFHIEMDGEVVVLHYAIADVDWFVQPGDAVDVEAWKRGVTIYLPDRRARLYPEVLSEGAASLLPDEVRPAYVFTVRIAADGGVTLAGCERAAIRSRAKLAYDAVTPEQLPDGFDELSRRIVAAEDARGAPRVELPEQELERDDTGTWSLTFRPRLDSENRNAGMSLACNLAVADALFAAKTGLFRTMPEVDESHVGRLRHVARAVGLDWPDGTSLAGFQRSLADDDPKAAAFLMAIRRAGGGATYEPFREGERPWHSAMQATYVHATAPLRRLADRHVIAAAYAVANGQPVPDWADEAFAALPARMDAAEELASRVERAAVDLAEAVLLSGRGGEQFDAVVISEDGKDAQIQITEPAVLARLTARKVDPGDRITVRVGEVDVAARVVHLERVG